MDWQQFEQAFSSPRVGRYLAHCRGDQGMAMEAYRHNLLIAGALTPFLAVVEVCLRNAINRQLVDHYGRLDWWEDWRDVPLFQKQSSQVMAAKAKLQGCIRYCCGPPNPERPCRAVPEIKSGRSISPRSIA